MTGKRWAPSRRSIITSYIWNVIVCHPPECHIGRGFHVAMVHGYVSLERNKWFIRQSTP
jgi:hypothetical protein